MDSLISLVKDLGLTEQDAIRALLQWSKWRATQKKSQQKYYAKNKEKVDGYHAEYRRTHPEYRERIAEKARRRKSKVLGS